MVPVNDLLTTPFPVPELLVRVVVAIVTGGLIGLERERRPTRKFAGLRTMALLCGAGPLVVFVARTEGAPVVIAIYVALAAVLAVAVAYVRFALTDEDVGFTTSITVLLVALLGVLVGYGRFFESTSIAIVIVVLLAEKERLHRYVAAVSDRELIDSLKLGALVFILYPIAPAVAVDPYGVLVPRDVLLFAIFVLSIQFASYVSMRQLGGSRGLALTGLLAGGANSFATAGVLARMARRSPDAVDAASAALLLASTSMILRNVAIAVVLAVGMLWALWLPAIAMVGLALIMAAVVWHRMEVYDRFDMDLDSPFSVTAAVKFTAAYVVVLIVAVVAEASLGEVGLYGTAFLGGLVSSAAVSVTAATVLNEGAVGTTQAAGMVVLGITASLTSKIVLVEVVSGRMRKAMLSMTIVGIVGVLVFLLL